MSSNKEKLRDFSMYKKCLSSSNHTLFSSYSFQVYSVFIHLIHNNFFLFILNINDIFNHTYRDFPPVVVSPQPINRKENYVDWEPIHSYHWHWVGADTANSSERRKPKQTNRSRSGYNKLIRYLVILMSK